jgi:hypothetical protein
LMKVNSMRPYWSMLWLTFQGSLMQITIEARVSIKWKIMIARTEVIQQIHFIQIRH